MPTEGVKLSGSLDKEGEKLQMDRFSGDTRLIGGRRCK